MKPKFFKSAADFRQWLERHHANATELVVGFYRKDSGKGGLAYPEAVDEALCFGWIDGVKKRLDEVSYTHRFSPRKPKSNWSNLNIRRAEALSQAGRMKPAGLRAFAARLPARAGAYSFENAPRTFAPAQERQFKADPKAWEFFAQQPPGYRRMTIWWVVSAKQEETRARRLAKLIVVSGKGRRM